MVSLPGDNEQSKDVRELVKNTTAMRLNTEGFKQLGTNLASNFNVITGLTKVFKKSEELQLRSLAMGTTYAKFSDANTKALTDTMATTQEMTDFLVGGFSKGLRDASKETIALADEMIVTGQNTEGLINAMSHMRMLTKDSNKIGGSLSKSMMENTKKFGVTGEAMIAALAAVQEALETAAVYGEESVGAYATLAADLKAAMGATVGADRNISAFLQVMKADNIAQQQLLGLGRTANKLNSGQKVSIEEVVDTLGKSLEIFKGDAVTRQFLANAYGEKNVKGMQMIYNALGQNNEMTKKMQADAAAKQKTAAAYERQVQDFYQTVAPEQYALLLKMLPLMAVGGAFGGPSKTAFKAARAGTAATLFSRAIPKAGLLRAGGTALLAGLGTLSLPLTAIAAGVIFLPKIVGLIKDVADNTGDAADLAKKEAREKERIKLEAGSVTSLARIASAMISEGSTEDHNRKTLKLLKQIRDGEGKRKLPNENSIMLKNSHGINK